MRRQVIISCMALLIPVLLVSLGMVAGGQAAAPLGGSGGCVAGATYDPTCDVNRDGNTDVVDIELVAGHWGHSGVWTTGHDHWGESWTGSGTGLTLSGGDTGLSASGNSFGVYGKSDSTFGMGVAGLANAASGTTYGVWGQSDSTSGTGVHGVASANTGTTYGVYGQSSSTEGVGVYGTAPVTGTMGIATSTDHGVGVYGESQSAGGFSGIGAGVYGLASNTNGFWTAGVIGSSLSPDGFGVVGSGGVGVQGESNATDGIGVYGSATANSGTTSGVYGVSDSTDGKGVSGYASASNGTTFGVFGESASTSGRGVYGYVNAGSGTTTGVYGKSKSTSGRGVVGVATATSGSTRGVYGRTYSSNGIAVYGLSSAASNGYAGFFQGDVTVLGTLLKSSGGFKIDHPLNPANKYLVHSFVESPDMKNVYDDVVTLDESGTAWVDLPGWFEALNQDFRYQLTPIGAPGPNLYIAQEIADNRFQIAGGEPGMKVSWQVTGIRHDAYAEAHRIPVEEEKSPEERGTYLHPLEHVQPKELGLDYQRNRDILEP